MNTWRKNYMSTTQDEVSSRIRCCILLQDMDEREAEQLTCGVSFTQFTTQRDDATQVLHPVSVP